jgi:DNA-binding IclR family transcriptional regulator
MSPSQKTPTIDQVLELLEDGDWHELNEITKKSGLQQPKLEAVVDFLEEYEFIHVDKEQQRARLTHPALKFFKKSSA